MKIIKKIKHWLWWKGIAIKDIVYAAVAMSFLLGGLGLMIYIISLSILS